MLVVFDVETDGFHPSVVHCIVAKIQETSEVFSFADHPGYLPLRDGIELLQAADYIVGHNIIRYDVPVLKRLCGLKIHDKFLIDTYPLVKKLIPNTHRLDESVPANLRGRQSIEAWGYRVGLLKGEFGKTANWKYFSDQMVKYCVRDVEISALLYEFLIELV